MSITDELRERARSAKPISRKDLFAIADRIDAEHEAKVSYWQGASYKDGHDEGFASADDWLAQHEDAMAEHGWIRLPKDADGEPWHIGDVTENGVVVNAMELDSHGWIFLCQDDIDPSIHRHYHAPTVEDVLREFADEVYADADNEIRDRDFLCAKYAKRLTLAEGEDA